MLEEVLRQIDYMRLLSGLNPRDKGLKILVNCPKCSDTEAYVFKDGQAIICRKANSCGQTTTLIEYVTGNRGQRGQEWLNAVQQLATEGGVAWQWTPTVEQRKKAEEEHARKDALDTLRIYATREFANHCSGFSSHPAADYLEARGFSLSDLAVYGFGLLADVRGLRNTMDLGSAASLKMATPQGFVDAWSDRILIPLRDRWGRLVGYAGRSYRADTKKKYLNTGGASIKDIVAIELHHALQHSDEIITVEGWLDPFKARQYGFHNVVGVGSTGNAMSAERWERLAEYGVKSTTFLTDADKAGKEGLKRAMENSLKAKKKPTIFIMSLPEGSGKDLDSWLDANSTTAKGTLPILYNQRIHVDRWRAQLFADGFKLDTEAGRHLYLEHCLNFDSGITDPLHETSLKQHFWPEVATLLDLPTIHDIVADVQGRLKAHKEKERARELVTAKIQELQRVCHRDPLKAMDEIQKVDLSDQIRSLYVTEVRGETELLLLDQKRLQDLSSREWIGLPQRVLPEWDRLLCGFRGLSLLAGLANSAKTIVALQALFEAVRFSDDVCGLFCSIEMPPTVLRSRLLSYLSGMTYNEIIKANHPEAPPSAPLRRATKQLEKAMKRIRFLNEDEPQGFQFTVRSVMNEMADLKARTGCKHCFVVVDYIGTWDVPNAKSEREEEKKQIEDMIRLRDANNGDPILGICEVRKGSLGTINRMLGPDDIMGSARQVYRADQITIINPFQAPQVGKHYEISDAYCRVRDTPAKEVKLDDDTYDTFKRWAASEGIWPMIFSVVKIRDGGAKGDFLSLVHWYQNKVRQGLHIRDDNTWE